MGPGAELEDVAGEPPVNVHVYVVGPVVDVLFKKVKQSPSQMVPSIPKLFEIAKAAVGVLHGATVI
jgi:hypothetical protein